MRTLSPEIAVAPIAFLVVDGRGKYLQANDAACKLFLLSRRELLSRSIPDLLCEESHEEGLGHFRQLQKSGNSTGTVRMKRGDGEVIRVRVTGIRMDGGVYGAYHEDVTLELETAEQLAATRQQYQEVLRTSQSGFFTMSADGHFMDCNDAFCSMLGYSREELSRMHIIDVDAIESGEGFRTRAEAIFKTGSARFQTKWRAKSGALLDVDVSTRWVDDPEGGHFFAFGRDVSEASRAIEKGKIDEQRLTSLLSLNEYVGEFDESALVRHCAEEAERITGSRIAYLHFVNEDQETISLGTWSRGTLEKCTAVFDNHYPISKAGVWADCARTKQPVLHNDFQKEVGNGGLPGGHSLLTRHLSVPVLENGQVRIIIGVGNKEAPYDEGDVRQLTLIGHSLWKILIRKRVEDRLRESEKKFRTAVDGVPFGLAIFSSDKKILHVNSALSQDFRYEPGQLTDLKRLTSLAFPDAGVRRTVRREVLEAVRALSPGSAPAGPFVYAVRCADGSEKIAEISIVHLGELLLLCVRDVTVSVHARKALLDAKEAAELSNQAKTAFLTTISHELRTPLNPIIGFTELLLEMTEDPDRKEMVEMILGSAKHLLHLIQEILDFTSAESGSGQIAEGPVVLRNFVETRIDVLRRKAADKAEVGIGFEIASGLPETIRTDPIRLRQALDQLLDNALKFTKKGGVRLDVRAASPGAEKKPMLEFVVADTGIGIPKEALANLFDPFFQVESTLSRSFGGIGLGLPLCKRLVESLGGKLVLRSEPGSGSTFTISIPLVDHNPPSVVPGRSGPSARLRVLAAEDEESNRRVLRRLLERFGIESRIVPGGHEAVEEVAHNPYDLVLMDIRMPGMDGCDAMRAIRRYCAENPGHPRPYIAAVSAYVSPEDTARSIEAGADEHVTKPLNIEKLKHLLDRARAFISSKPAGD